MCSEFDFPIIICDENSTQLILVKQCQICILYPYHLNATCHIEPRFFENFRVVFKMHATAFDCSESSFLRSGKWCFLASDSTTPQHNHHRDTHLPSHSTANRPSFGPSFCSTCLIEVSSPGTRMRIQSCEPGVSARRGNWLRTGPKAGEPLLTLGDTSKRWR